MTDNAWVFLPLAFVGIICLSIAIPIMISTILRHFQKMAEIKSRASGIMAADFRLQIESVLKEIEKVKDTSAQYDISLDNSLHQLNMKMSQIEQRISALENSVSRTTHNSQI
jgi:hypothetical protein